MHNRGRASYTGNPAGPIVLYQEAPQRGIWLCLMWREIPSHCQDGLVLLSSVPTLPLQKGALVFHGTKNTAAGGRDLSYLIGI